MALDDFKMTLDDLRMTLDDVKMTLGDTKTTIDDRHNGRCTSHRGFMIGIDARPGALMIK